MLTESSTTIRPELMTRTTNPEAETRRRVEELQAGIAVEKNSRRLFERYYPRVLRFVRRRGLSGPAEDLTQDTFIRVFREIRSFRGQSSFESWLFAIAANICRNERRRLGREKRAAPEVSLDAGDDPDAPRLEIAAEQAAPDQAAFEQERRAALNRAVLKLPPQMRQCLALRLDRGLKYREIAVLLKISIDTVKAHLFQARKRLKDELGDELGKWED